MRAKRDKFLNQFLIPPVDGDKVLNNESILETASRTHYGYKESASTGSGARNTISPGTNIGSRIGNAIRRGRISARPTSKQRGTSLSKNKLSAVANSPHPGKGTYTSGKAHQTILPRKSILKTTQKKLSSADNEDYEYKEERDPTLLGSPETDDELLQKLNQLKAASRPKEEPEQPAVDMLDRYYKRLEEEIRDIAEVPKVDLGEIIINTQESGTGGQATLQADALYKMMADGAFGEDIKDYVTTFPKMFNTLKEDYGKAGKLITKVDYNDGNVMNDLPNIAYDRINSIMAEKAKSLKNSDAYKQNPVIRALVPLFGNGAVQFKGGQYAFTKFSGSKSQLRNYLQVMLSDNPVNFFEKQLNHYNAIMAPDYRVNIGPTRDLVNQQMKTPAFDAAIESLKPKSDAGKEPDTIDYKALVRDADRVAEAMGVLNWLGSGQIMGTPTPYIQKYIHIMQSPEFKKWITDPANSGMYPFSKNSSFADIVKDVRATAGQEIDQLEEKISEPGKAAAVAAFLKNVLLPEVPDKAPEGEMPFRPNIYSFMKIAMENRDDPSMQELMKKGEAISFIEEFKNDSRTAMARLNGEDLSEIMASKKRAQLYKDLEAERAKLEAQPVYRNLAKRFGQDIKSMIKATREQESESRNEDQEMDEIIEEGKPFKIDALRGREAVEVYKEDLEKYGKKVYEEGEEKPIEILESAPDVVELSKPKMGIIAKFGPIEGPKYWNRVWNLMAIQDPRDLSQVRHPEAMSEGQIQQKKQLTDMLMPIVQRMGGNPTVLSMYATQRVRREDVPDEAIAMIAPYYEERRKEEELDILSEPQEYLQVTKQVSIDGQPVKLANPDYLINARKFLKSVSDRLELERERTFGTGQDAEYYRVRSLLNDKVGKMFKTENSINAMKKQLELLRVKKILEGPGTTITDEQIQKLQNNIYETKQTAIGNFLANMTTKNSVVNYGVSSVYANHYNDILSGLMNDATAQREELKTLPKERDPDIVDPAQALKDYRTFQAKEDTVLRQMKDADDEINILTSIFKTGTSRFGPRLKTQEELQKLTPAERKEYEETVANSYSRLQQLKSMQNEVPVTELQNRIPDEYFDKGVKFSVADRRKAAEILYTRRNKYTQLRDQLLETRVREAIKLDTGKNVLSQYAQNEENFGVDKIAAKKRSDALKSFLGSLEQLTPQEQAQALEKQLQTLPGKVKQRIDAYVKSISNMETSVLSRATRVTRQERWDISKAKKKWDEETEDAYNRHLTDVDNGNDILLSYNEFNRKKEIQAEDNRYNCMMEGAIADAREEVKQKLSRDVPKNFIPEDAIKTQYALLDDNKVIMQYTDAAKRSFEKIIGELKLNEGIDEDGKPADRFDLIPFDAEGKLMEKEKVPLSSNTNLMYRRVLSENRYKDTDEIDESLAKLERAGHSNPLETISYDTNKHMLNWLRLTKTDPVEIEERLTGEAVMKDEDEEVLPLGATIRTIDRSKLSGPEIVKLQRELKTATALSGNDLDANMIDAHREILPDIGANAFKALQENIVIKRSMLRGLLRESKRLGREVPGKSVEDMRRDIEDATTATMTEYKRGGEHVPEAFEARERIGQYKAASRELVTPAAPKPPVKSTAEPAASKPVLAIEPQQKAIKSEAKVESADMLEQFLNGNLILEFAGLGRNTKPDTASGNRLRARMKRSQALIATQGGEGSGHDNLTRLGIVHPITDLHNFMRTGAGGSDKIKRENPRYKMATVVRGMRVKDPQARNNAPVQPGFSIQRGSKAGQKPYKSLLSQLDRKRVYDGDLIDK